MSPPTRLGSLRRFLSLVLTKVEVLVGVVVVAVVFHLKYLMRALIGVSVFLISVYHLHWHLRVIGRV